MKTKKAAVLPAATTKKLQCTAYSKATRLSSLKTQIGELLLYMQRPLSPNRQRHLWRLFESNLRKYYAVISPYRILQDACGEGFSTVECPNGSQRVCDKGVATE